MIGSSTVQSQTGETHKHVGRYIKVNRFCRVSGGPKGCQPGSIASPNHINLRDLFFKCNHYLHNELHFDFAFDFDFSRVMLMCSLLTRPLCISLETRLVLNIDCIKQFSLCVCVCVCVCVTVVLADVSCGLIDVQAATKETCLENLLFCIHPYIR